MAAEAAAQKDYFEPDMEDRAVQLQQDVYGTDRLDAGDADVRRRGDAGLTSYLLNFELTPAFF